MSTAGKVLISLIMVMALVWIAATAGVDQLNRNGNSQLIKLREQIADLSEKVKKTQHDIVETKDLITLQQEKTDREITRLRSNQLEVERSRSQTTEILEQVKIELANLQDTLKNANLADQRRTAEGEEEKKNIQVLQTELTGLKATNKQMIDRIVELREKFRVAYRANLDSVSKPK